MLYSKGLMATFWNLVAYWTAPNILRSSPNAETQSIGRTRLQALTVMLVNSGTFADVLSAKKQAYNC